MESSSNNNVLLTGDSNGYIKIWDILDYCNGSDVEDHRNHIAEENSNDSELDLDAWFNSLSEDVSTYGTNTCSSCHTVVCLAC